MAKFNISPDCPLFVKEELEPKAGSVPGWRVVVGHHGQQHTHRHLVVAPVQRLVLYQLNNALFQLLE